MPIPYPAQLVRQQDYDRFLLSLFAPADRRDDLLALYAFNAEIARVREQVREPMMGHMRLQWWRDGIAGIYEGKTPAHEILQPLAQAITRHTLPRAWYDQLIDARETDLDEKPPATLGDFLDYVKATSEPLAKLGALILKANGSDTDDGMQAAIAAGSAYALTGLLRATSFMAHRRRLYLPQDILKKYNIAPSRIFDLKPPPELRNAVQEIRRIPEARLAQSIAQRRMLSAASRKKLAPVLLQADLARLYAATIRHHHDDVFAPRISLRHPLSLPILLWKYWLP